ncbi:cofactor-independent phosphoglycerate mutase [Candidatus Woesearchaeota archaeon]|nr:cofactor-independent phosphoglycerate mutase [Candidatus Woesearchaeota archaeon]
MKYIIFLGDGMGDYALKELDGKSPLQAARTPNMDWIAAKGRVGRLITIPKGLPPGSDVANLSVLGYDPKECYTGRGPLEAASMGVELSKDDIAFRCNLITEKNGVLNDYSAGHISNEEAAELMRVVQVEFGKPDVEFHNGVSYRHLLVLKNGNFSEKVDCTPPHDVIGDKIAKCLVKAKSGDGEKTTHLLNKMILDSKNILSRHPVNMSRVKNGMNPGNMIWPWSPGKKPSIKSFQELYGIKGAAISAVDIIFGLGVYAGFKPIKVEGATGLYNTNYEGKADACIKALEDFDLVFVHVEAPDEASHGGDLKLKIKTIEDFDKRLVGRVLKKVDLKKTTIAVLPDHLTPVKVKTHVSEPVPFAIYNPKARKDSVKFFNEFSAELGSLGTIKPKEFIKTFLGM